MGDMNFVDPARKPASSCLYLVLQARGHWWVEREGKSFGPCADKDEAIDSAFKIIQLFGDPARSAEVWAPDEDGKMQLVWKGRV
jgi:hypothetical protein